MESSIPGKKSTVNNNIKHLAKPSFWGGLINTVEGKDEQEREKIHKNKYMAKE